jgi:hypothetical protein
VSFPTKVVAAAVGMVGQDIVGNYYTYLYANRFEEHMALLKNYLYASEFISLRKATWDRILIDIEASDAAKHIRLGIYDDLNGYPKNLVVDAGEVPYIEPIQVASILEQLDAGTRYWLVLLSDTNEFQGLIKITGVGGIQQCAGWTIGDPDLVRYGSRHSFRVAQAYGALPSTFPLGGDPLEDMVMGLALRLASIP